MNIENVQFLLKLPARFGLECGQWSYEFPSVPAMDNYLAGAEFL
jgi:hypothetical protein